MRKFIFLLLGILFFSYLGKGQNPEDTNDKKLYAKVVNRPLTPAEEMRYKAIPKLKVLKAVKTLPSKVNNADLPFFPPVGSQCCCCCAQWSSHNYTFTYENNCAHNRSANTTSNRYPAHYTYAYVNGGGGTGTERFLGWEVSKSNGCPSIETYEGNCYVNAIDDTKWMNGYDKYYNAMHNKTDQIYYVDVSTPTGINTLKRWFFDHADGSQYGGIANFSMAGYGPSRTLPAGTEDAGKYVFTQCGSSGHSVTAVGYNDNIRYDVNGDGQYTNDIDITGDGVVNVRDWEIGGIIMVNSFGTGWGNNGFSYMLYRALALPEGSGINANRFEMIRVKKDYQPLLTYKASITHSKRSDIKLTVGVAKNLSATEPEFVHEYHVFNHQGGDQPMEGYGGSSTIEIGLDATPLLQYFNSGEQVKFFFNVYNIGNTGTVNSLSVIDYTTGNPVETVCQQSNVALNNGLTRLSLIKSVTVNDISITTNSLGIATPDVSYSIQLSASGGTAPYKWRVNHGYSKSNISDAFPNVTNQVSYVGDGDMGFSEIDLDFEFPIFDKKYTKASMATNGFLGFYQDFDDPEPYITISPFAADLTGGKLYYQGNTTEAAFRWVCDDFLTGGVVEFAVKIYPDGEIDMYFRNYPSNPSSFICGVFNQQNGAYWESEYASTYLMPDNYKFRLTPVDYPYGMTLSNDGIFSGTPAEDNIWNINVEVSDANGLIRSKILPFSSGGGGDVTTSEASILIQNNIENGNFVILDVRTPSEFASGYIKNSLNLDFNSALFDTDLNQLDKSKTYLVYCNSGNKSAQTIVKMETMGFGLAFKMLGGIQQWMVDSYPVVSVSSPVFEDITVARANAMIQQNTDNSDFVLLDVRTPVEYDTRHIEGAVNLDFYSSTFDTELNNLDKSKRYIVYCSTINRSVQTITKMQNFNFIEVYNMLGGINNWVANGLPTIINDTNPPSVPTGLASPDKTYYSVDLTWVASTDDIGIDHYTVKYGTTVIDVGNVTAYTVEGLASKTTYSFTVTASDATGNESGASIPLSATTDTEPTCITVTYTLSLDGFPEETTWDIKNAVGTVLHSGGPYNNPGDVGETKTETFCLDKECFDFTIYDSYGDGLEDDPAGSYSLVDDQGNVLASGSGGDFTESATTNFCLGSGTDIEAPSAPTNLTANDITQTGLLLSWNASSDNIAVTGYDIYEGGMMMGSVATTSFGIAWLTCDSNYSFTVRAKDAAGNVSAESAPLSVITLPCDDTEPPSTPTNLAASGITQTSIDLSWTASTDNVNVADYDILIDGLVTGNSETPSFTATNLTCGSTYNITIRAKDAVGNMSAESDPLEVSTVSCSCSYCASKGNSVGYEWITGVKFNAFTKVSGKENGGYSDFTSTDVIDLATNFNVDFELTANNTKYTEHFIIWIDYNCDCDFDDPGEMVFSGSGTGTVTGSFQTPKNVACNSRLRVAMRYNSAPPSCEAFDYGEVEDYAVSFGPPPVTYVLTTSTVGRGTVTPFGGRYEVGTPVELTAAPDAGWKFESWSGDATGTGNPVTVVMNADMTVSAIFTELANIPPTVSITLPSDSAQFNENADIMITASADDADGSVNLVEFFEGSTKIGEATSAPYTITWSGVAIGNYLLTVVATDNQGASTTSTAINIAVKKDDLPPNYCEASGTNGPEYIARVQVGTIDNSSARTMYSDFTSISTSMTVGSSHPITISIGDIYSGDKVTCWVDWNIDGDFEDANEKIVLTISGSTATGTITVPTSAAVGLTGLRVRLFYYAAGDTPCSSSTYGEVEDYVVNISAASSNMPLADNGFKIYPNPSSGEFNVILSGEMNVTNIRILNISGQIVFMKSVNNEMTIPVNIEVENGNYIVQILNNEIVLWAQMIVVN